MFNKIKSLLGVKTTTEPESEDTPAVGAVDRYTPHLPIFGMSGFGLRNGSYDNTYPSISRIADAIAEVQPIAINAKGEEVKNAHVLEVLNRPNKEMCSTDFMEALAVMLLVHPKIYLLAWHRGANGELVAGGAINERNLAGLTFMEGVSERIVAGESSYTVDGKVYTEREVLTLSLAINPYKLSDGYSPSVASKKWATTDDYIAEYHNAQFRNNARPAGMLTIVADSAEEFNREVDIIEAKFRGASNAGNTIYNMRPSNTLDGKPAPAKLEWTPFAQTNKDLTLEAVYKQANHKLESVFGVPDEVRGHLQNSNYSSAEVADYIFARRVIYPMLVKIYSKLTHELNRITGGLGYALSFHYEMPMLTDTRKLQAEALKTMIDAGFTVESSVEALRLPESYNALKMREQNAREEKRLDEPNLVGVREKKAGFLPSRRPRRASPEELRPASERGGVLAQSARNAEDSERNRPLAGEFPSDAGREERSSDAGQARMRAASPTIEKQDDDSDELPANKEELVAPELVVAYDKMTGRIGEIIGGELGDLFDSPEDELEGKIDRLEQKLIAGFSDDSELSRHVKEIQEAFDNLRKEQTATSEQELGQQLGVEVSYAGDSIKERVAEMTYDDLYDSYRATALSLLNFTAQSIYDYADEENAEDAVRTELNELVKRSHWRAVRFGFTEQQLVLAFTAEALWEWATREYAFKGYKTWHISPLSPAPCEECIKLDGEQVRVGENFSNGKPYPPYHPNCYCYVEYSAERKPSRKITCPKCGRFLMDLKEASIDKMICPNTKCKTRLSVDATTGEAPIIKEIKEEG